ncbi:MAG: glycosyltransferase family 4 protein, partial [Desulfococcaceae bacterium]|nr:glycosyltransferase family 4 protein [Desulfococcaceae bacterium]
MNIKTKFSVLYVIDGLEFGGGERVFLQLAAGLKKRFDISVASSGGGIFEKRVRQMKIPFFPVDMSRKLSLDPILQLRQIIRKNHIDLIHSQGARADFFSRPVCGNIINICTVAMPVEGFDVHFIRKYIYRLFDSLTERKVSHFIVVSDALKQLLTEKRGIPSHKITRIYNGIETAQYHPDVRDCSIRKEFNISENIPLIGAVGRMVWQKGFRFLVQAVPCVLNIFPGVKFILAGDGPELGYLKALAEQSDIRENIIFTGFRNDIAGILSAADLLAIPSLSEGFPMITLEAMAMEKPIIASNIPGISEQISDGENGRLIPPKDSAALSKAIIEMLN